MAAKRTYTRDQIVTAARELREAAGVVEARFTGDQVIDMLGGEIQILRERGFTDERITGLFTGFDIELKPRQLERRSRTPINWIRPCFGAGSTPAECSPTNYPASHPSPSRTLRGVGSACRRPARRRSRSDCSALLLVLSWGGPAKSCQPPSGHNSNKPNQIELA